MVYKNAKYYIAAFCGLVLSSVTTSHAMLEIMGIGLATEIADYIKNNKSPIKIIGVKGSMPQDYLVVQTTIKVDSKDVPKGQLGPSPVIIRKQIGKISASNTACMFDVTLDVPRIPIDLNKATYNMPEIATKLSGAVDPTVGAVVGACSALTEISLQMTSDMMNKIFGVNETTLTFIDILPAQYYKLNMSTNQFEVTPKFLEDLPNYVKLYTDTVPLAKAYNNANKKYNDALLAYKKKWKTTELLDDQAESDYDAVLAVYNNELVPALRTLVVKLKELERMGMHRVSIMGSNEKPGSGSSCSGGWKGPFNLYVYYYLGAKVTNIFNVDFCVSSKGKVQNVEIALQPNLVKEQPFTYVRGGIKFQAVGSNHNMCKGTDCNIAFPDIQAGDKLYLPESQVYSWWDSAITSADEGIGLAQYLLPFDLYKLENDLKEQQQKKKDELSKKALDSVSALTSLLQQPGTQAKLVDPNAAGTGSPQTPKTMDDILGMATGLTGSHSNDGDGNKPADTKGKEGDTTKPPAIPELDL